MRDLINALLFTADVHSDEEEGEDSSISLLCIRAVGEIRSLRDQVNGLTGSLERAESVLQNLMSYLSVNGCWADLPADEAEKRIRDGIDMLMRPVLKRAESAEAIVRMADCKTVDAFLALPDDAKRVWFAQAVEDSERRKEAEDALKEAQEQEPVAFRSTENEYSIVDAHVLRAMVANYGDKRAGNVYTIPLYARPVPAPAVTEYMVPFTDNDLAEIHQLAYELGGTDSGEYILDGEQLDQVIVKAASLFYKPAVAVPAVPAVPAMPEEIQNDT